MQKEKNKLRIALISRAVYPFHDYGGLEKHLYYQVRHLSEQGADIELFTEPATVDSDKYNVKFPRNIKSNFISGRLVPIPRKKGFIILDRIINYPYLTRLFARDVIKKHLEKQYDLVFAHGLAGWGVYREFKKNRLRLPVILNPHGMEEFKNRNPLKTLMYRPFMRKMRKAASFSDKIVATDIIMIPEVKSYLGVDDSKIILLPNAIDIEEALSLVSEKKKTTLIKKHNLKNKLFFYSVGRLEANKGFDNLLVQFHRIKTEIKHDWILLITGKGSKYNYLKDLIDELDLAKNVHLTGPVADDELHTLLDLSDIFILPSLYEGSSIATLEAMVHKCPVIANRIGGLPDKVDQYTNGILCDPDSPDELGDAIIELAGFNNKKLQDMGEQSFKIVSDKFSWKSVAEESIRIFKGMIK
ncbi:MAG: glycosyltransferase family 4 protein [Acidobacteria bacterium]|nr:glycosyltransferase family 4 protein [Acidobacteriota bacterium]